MAHESEIINTYKHPFVGIKWPVTGSKGNEYIVTMRDSGFDCDCIAFRKCKHIKEVEKRIVGED
tara:strand:- start:70 stop:261 length:192 start_codon:yes stop_codon:yes gene_type:complete